MAFEWDPADRSAFDEALVEHLISIFPEARPGWTEYGRRLLLTFPDGAVCTLWEPNFYFSFPSYTIEWLFERAVQAIDGQHQALINHEVI